MDDSVHYTQGEPEQAYVKACVHGRFAYTRCRSCGGAQLAARRSCVRCGATDLGTEFSRGEGTIASFTEVHRAASARFSEQVPFVLVLVDMEEGYRAMMQFRGVGAPQIGGRVRVGFAPYGLGGEMLPFAEYAERQ